MSFDEFSRMERTGWERVAERYDGAWAALTTQFVEPLLKAARVIPLDTVLDTACGPGYVAAAAKRAGAVARGIDFSPAMVAFARRMNPGIDFLEGTQRISDSPPGVSTKF